MTQFGTVGFEGLQIIPNDLFLLNPGNQHLITGKRNWNYILKQIGIPVIPILILFVIIGVISGPSLINEIRLLNAETKTTEAQVIDNRISRGKSTSYYITYKIVRDGVSFRREENVGRDLYNKYGIGSYVPVTYLINDPHVSHVGGAGFKWNAILPVLITMGIFLVVGGFVTLKALPRIKRMRRLRQEGQMLTGQMLWSKSELVKRGSGKNRRTDLDVTVRYRFKTPTGRQIETQITKVRNDLKNKLVPQAGSLVVLYADEMDYEVL